MKRKKLTCQLLTLGSAGLGLNLKLWSGVPQLKKRKWKKKKKQEKILWFLKREIKGMETCTAHIKPAFFYTQLWNGDFFMNSTRVYESHVLLADNYRYCHKRTWTLKSEWTVSLETQNLGRQKNMHGNQLKIIKLLVNLHSFFENFHFKKLSLQVPQIEFLVSQNSILEPEITEDWDSSFKSRSSGYFWPVLYQQSRWDDWL